MSEKNLYTHWGRQLQPDKVLQEYPRPELVRESYINLNGYWEYAFTKSEEFPEKYDGRILVPFSPEAPLSGVNRQLQPDEYLHYRRTFRTNSQPFTGEDNSSVSRRADKSVNRHADKSEDKSADKSVNRRGDKSGAGHRRCRWLLHFGAVDQTCSVYVNGQKAGSHTGGYLPFSFDVTDLLREGENVLQVMVRDLSDTSWHAKGKQSLQRGGMWYTAQSGIWQTVWMEEVPEHYIREIKIIPDYDNGQVKIRVMTNHPERKVPVRVQVFFRGMRPGRISREDVFEEEPGAAPVSDRPFVLRLQDFKSWTPEEPNLYDIRIEMGEDDVSSYFGMRKLSLEPDSAGVLRFFLNNQPYFHNGVLDQGYYPDGLYTAPADEAMCYDIRTMKALGFNMLRKHCKIEPSRWYYHCDRLGMLVWQDMVCGGDRYPYWFATLLPNLFPPFGRLVRDHRRNYGLFARKSAAGRDEYLREMKQTVRHLSHHPAIAAWVPFNEGWGQFEARKVTGLLRRLDPSRLIDEASGWFDQGGGDMYSIHNYFRSLRVRPRPGRAVALTECGGYSYLVPDHSFCKEVYGYRKYTSREALTAALARLWEKQLIPAATHCLAASVYTQVSDIEDEVNGLLTYDREILKVDPKQMKALNRRLKDAQCMP